MKAKENIDSQIIPLFPDRTSSAPEGSVPTDSGAVRIDLMKLMVLINSENIEFGSSTEDIFCSIF